MKLWPTTATRGRMPNFLLIGAMKAGTTSLYHYLQAHPQVFLPHYKAPEFFVAESNFCRGIDWYRKQFTRAESSAIAVGEASNAYAKYPQFGGVPRRIAEYIPDVRLVYIVRDPIARIRSHYQTRFAEGTERLPLEQAVLRNPIYLHYSKYAMQIEQYLKFFRREQMLVITAEDLRLQRVATVRTVYEFLGVDPTAAPDELNREYYQTKDRAVRSPIPLGLRKSLKRYLPYSKRFKELENNVFGRLSCLRRDRSAADASSRRVVVPEPVRRRLADELHDDVSRLRQYMSPEFSGWDIA